MNLIVVLLTLFIDHRFGSNSGLRSFEWFDRGVVWAIKRCGDKFWQLILVLVIALAVPALIIHALSESFEGVMFGLLGLVWSVVVLLFCLGPLALDRVLSEYTGAVEDGSEDVAEDRASQISGNAEFESPEQRNASVVAGVYAQVNTQILTPVFWFLVLGPFGAVLYRLALQIVSSPSITDQISEEAAARIEMLLGIFTWLPARILIVAYALAGKFECTLNSLLGPSEIQSDSTIFDDTNAALAESGFCASGLERDNKLEIDDVLSARELVVRSIVVCLAGLALMTLSGWAN
ncbi:MAG: regulatory signaling modulator protein AmpE [Pseudomonadota bacterium]